MSDHDATALDRRDPGPEATYSGKEMPAKHTFVNNLQKSCRCDSYEGCT